MRSFPSAPWLRRTLDRMPAWAHPQWLVTILAALVAVVGLTVPLAHADDDRDDLKHKQDQIKGQISSVKGEIHEASAQVAKISGQLANAQKQLTAARTRYSAVRGQLATAQAAAAALATKLASAQAKLVAAQAALDKAKAAVAGQREASRDTIITMATGENPDLALLSAYADGESMDEVLRSLTANGVITGRQQQTLDQLVVVQKQLTTQEAAVRDARNDVASAKSAADANVVKVAGLVNQASAAAVQVSSLVNRTSSARAAVVRARAADQAALRRLQAREASIKRKIMALSRKQGGSYNGDTGGLLAKPGPGPVTSPYGWRIHPIYGYYGLHNGIDFGTGCGARLVAGESGTVVDKYFDEVYGNRLYLAIGKVNGASIVLVYNHMSGYAVGEGQHVKRGQVVGYSGSTGWSTGCHLHFIVMRNGEAVNPAPYL